ncbi:MAG: TCP-1/cpn60 chaperonin family protein, partial [Zestosphaera sp.]
NALEIIPRTLAENAGMDPIDSLLKLRSEHQKGNRGIGIDAISIDRTIEHRSLSLYTNIDEEFINILRMQEYTALLGHDILLRKNIYILENLDMNDIPQDVNRGLLIALPLFRFTSLTEKKTLITALPCRVIFLPEPEGSIEEVIKKLRALEKELSEIVK